MDKKLKELPWPTFHEDSNVWYKVTVNQPVIKGERLLIVTFTPNTGYQQRSYEREFIELRVICKKKNGTPIIINRFGSQKKAFINELWSRYWNYALIEEEDKKRITSYIKSNETNTSYLIRELLTWVKKSWDEDALQKKKSQGKILDEDFALCPEELPEGMVEWIRQYILPADKVILHKKGGWKGRCYVCGQEVEANQNRRFKHCTNNICPECGSVVTCYRDTSDAWNTTTVENIVAVQKGTDGKTIFFRQWRLLRDHTAKWEDIPRCLKEVTRYAIRGKETTKWQKEGKDNYYMRCERYTLDNWTRWSGNHIYDNGYCFYLGNTKEELVGTQMQYADLEGYLREARGHNRNPIYFLEYFVKYPVTEFLWKAGYRHLVHQKIFGLSKENRNTIFWQRTKLKDCFRFPVRLLKVLPPDEWTMDRVAIAGDMWKRQGGKLSEEELKAALRLGHGVNQLHRALNHATIVKVSKYIEKQFMKGKGPETELYDGIDDAIRTYRDYLNECEQLQLPLMDHAILFPPHLMAAHERTMAQVKFERNKADQEKFQKQIEDLEKYIWEKDGLTIRPPQKQEEITKEGVALHHCVGGYLKRMAEGETAILFLRHASEPDKPFYTLELNPKSLSIVQCRTDHNKSYDREPEIKDFVDTWLKKVVRKGKKKKIA
ncbi:PcfJ domain-containing protein [Anaerotignum sp. MB30-C6]|uniref:PcfJ domain-containing protein n=1 Tax=Anaerotignum sp. MB30-C6 TaxID=3070814 RepID=UPI0027DC1B72|nr:PcfJ domain-containing protein [Anaerotignum sp. MB30-C6]WMI81575.1 PcfJ domain-containing protein [Anaerotignum sp. MB30-C6]